MKEFFTIIYLIFLVFSACNNKESGTKIIQNRKYLINKDSANGIISKKVTKKNLLDTSAAGFNDSDLVDISLFSDKFIIKMRYAEKNNFLDTILYPCAKCLLRYEVLKDLLKAEEEFEKDGYRILIYDCYRPLRVQKLMWKKIPVIGLVANPKTGSRHNRGSAVDLSLTDLYGNELDFGTPHDDFSKKARTFYSDLPDTVKVNRIYLRKIMEKHNFKGINSEWWHFSHNCGTKYKISDKNFDCN